MFCSNVLWLLEMVQHQTMAAPFGPCASRTGRPLAPVRAQPPASIALPQPHEPGGWSDDAPLGPRACFRRPMTRSGSATTSRRARGDGCPPHDEIVDRSRHCSRSTARLRWCRSKRRDSSTTRAGCWSAHCASPCVALTTATHRVGSGDRGSVASRWWRFLAAYPPSQVRSWRTCKLRRHRAVLGSSCGEAIGHVGAAWAGRGRVALGLRYVARSSTYS